MKDYKTIKMTALLVAAGFLTFLSSCNNDDGTNAKPAPTGDEVEFDLGDSGNSGISGTATFAKIDDGSITITLELSGTSASGDHPVHIHMNTAVETGPIVLDLTNVDGSTGLSETTVTALNDGSILTYEQLVDFDGYINVHNSASDLGTLVAQGDIGQNDFTGMSKSYLLDEKSGSGISGNATFWERANGETLIDISLTGDPVDSDHPAHVHMNTAVETGGIVIDLNNVMNGASKTNVAALNDATTITYTELLNYDGYINIHESAADLGSLVAQGDIGQNELTGMSETYTLNSVSDPLISGDVEFSERANGETLIEIELTGDAVDSDHPAHIHMNTAVVTGGIVIDLNNVMDGKSKTNISALNDGTTITYTELADYDGYINVHNSAADLGTLVAQGDIGQNALTGMSQVYMLAEVAASGISGDATFWERDNGETLVVISLMGDPSDSDHPAHIHMNSAAMTGGIAIDLINVMNGESKTNIAELNDATAITYTELVGYNGYINIHNSSADLGTLVSQGDIGSNVN